MDWDHEVWRKKPDLPLAFEDHAFVRADNMRSLRLAMEYERVEQALRKARIRSTVVVFGSARPISPADARRRLATASAPSQRRQLEKLVEQSTHYEQARNFGRLVAKHGGALAGKDGPLDNVIATGGGPGIMEAANRGASDEGAPSIGFRIDLPRESGHSSHSTPALTFRFQYFAVRKMHMTLRASAVAAFPGGFGTLDELFKVLTLVQTRKAPRIPVVLVGRTFWERAVDFDALAEAGMIDEKDRQLYEIVDDAEAAWETLARRGIDRREG